tara:strand:- start:12 stop:242 length:231 start_codon:yes stop_codon:yes gene_type:complete
MNIGMFIIGGLIFSVYMYFTIWNIYYSSKKQREENYPTLRKSKFTSWTSSRQGISNGGTTTNPRKGVRYKKDKTIK